MNVAQRNWLLTEDISLHKAPRILQIGIDINDFTTFQCIFQFSIYLDKDRLLNMESVPYSKNHMNEMKGYTDIDSF